MKKALLFVVGAWITLCAVWRVQTACAADAQDADRTGALRKALETSRIKGGLCVVLGAADVHSVAALAKDTPFLIHWLTGDPARVGAAREALLAARLYGKASVELWQGPSLPYADNLVSLLVVIGESPAGEVECMRVLRPGGERMMLQQDAQVKTLVKPRPEGMDEWTHWRHGPDRNSVSRDKLVELPRRVQFLFNSNAVGERSHVLATGERIFAQDRSTLIARDAFNGLPLWKSPLQKGSEFDWEYSVKVAMLVVAKDQRVYALCDDGKLKALDAATGRCVFVYEQAGKPFNMVLVDDAGGKLGTLVLAGQDSIRALDARSGTLLWKREVQWPTNLIASSTAAFYIDGSDRRGATEGTICAHELRTGKVLWQKGYYWARRSDLGAFGYDRLFFELRAPHNWRQFYAEHPEEKEKDRYGLVILSAKTGEEVQKVYNVGSSSRHGEFRTAFWWKEHLVTEANTREGLSLAMYRLDDFSSPATLFKANFVGDKGFGHCYPPVLTDRYYINGQMNFTDLQAHTQVSNQITRGACNTARPGYLPAYGMIYTFPKHCACFPMLDGNVCLAPAYASAPQESNELVKGPAWPAAPVEIDYSRDWTTFRHDEFRTGGTDAAAPARLDVLWSRDIPGPTYEDPVTSEWLDNPYTPGSITAPVVAGGLVYVAQCHSHRLVALDEKNGEPKWQFVAEGRLDGPPTIHKGLCLIGCRNGWVYCLRAADGGLVYKLRVAPYERRISTYGQLESPWPVAGSVLVVDTLAYVSAGLHPNADGGVRVVCFKPESGEIVWQRKFDDLGFADPWPAPWDPRKSRPECNPWRTIRPLEYRHFDLPVRDGDALAVSRCQFDLKTGQVALRKASGFYQVKPSGAYLPRTAWRYNDTHPRFTLAVCRGASVFSTVPGKGQLFRADFAPGKPFTTDWVQVSEEATKAGLVQSTTKLLGTGGTWAVDAATGPTTMHRAMLVAGDRLFVALPKGRLLAHSVDKGTKVDEAKLDEIAWDGLAAAHGRLYVSTANGKLVCLGAR